MKAEKLTKGLRFKNYGELCAFLEIKRNTGNAKMAQLNDLDRYCKVYKDGHAFVIDEVYDTAIERNDGRGRESYYQDFLPLLISDYLLSNRQRVHYITRNDMLKNIQMINHNYAYGSKNVKELAKYTQIDEQVVHDFYNTTNSNFKRILERSLDDLADSKMIFYQTTIMMALNIDGKSILVEADEIQIEKILSAERIALQDMKMDNMKQVRVNPYKWKLFTQHTVDHLNEKRTDEEGRVKYYYLTYKIIVNNEYLEEDHNRMLFKVLDEQSRQGTQDELNNITCDRLLENAAKRKNKAIDISYNKLRNTRMGFSYLENNQKLIELLIDNKNKTNLQQASKKK